MCAPFWQGRAEAGNGVRAWWSDDLETWHTTPAPALMFPSYPYNTDVTPVANKTLVTWQNGSVAIVDDASASASSNLAAVAQPLNFVLVSENGHVVAHAGPDRNLTSGWVRLGQCGRDANGTKKKGDCGFGACPAVHYGEEDGYFYVISGGREIALARSKDFAMWEHGPTLVSADIAHDAQLSPFMGIASQAAGKVPATAEHAAAAASLRSTLAHPECWEFDVNDSDMCCGGQSYISVLRLSLASRSFFAVPHPGSGSLHTLHGYTVQHRPSWKLAATAWARKIVASLGSLKLTNQQKL